MTTPVDATNKYAAMEAAVLALAEKLGLPKHLIGVELHFRAGELPRVRVEFYSDLGVAAAAVESLQAVAEAFELRAFAPQPQEPSHAGA